MKCPQCGRWNRATLPQCFYCGAALPRQDAQEADAWRARQERALQSSADTIYEVEEDGEHTAPRPDDRDRLAMEMQSFHVRRKRGEEQQRRIRQQSAERGMSPNANGVWVETRPMPVHTEAGKDGSSVSPSNAARPGGVTLPLREPAPEYGGDDWEDQPAYVPLWDDGRRAPKRQNGISKRSMRHVRLFGLRRLLPYLAILLVVIGLSCGAYYLLERLRQNAQTPQDAPQVVVFPSLQSDMAAHTVQIPAEEGAQIYIRELRRSYIATGGYAEIIVPDYIWYELEPTVDSPTMDVTLTPYLRTSAGEQRLMDPVVYTIDIPLSPITLVTPYSNYLEVSSSPYLIQFRVAQNSTVFINGEDYSSFVNTQDGLISYNATVQAIGENVFDIVVNCQYYRQNTLRIVLYRQPQDIPLELSATLGTTSANNHMTIRGTTVAGATITVASPYESLDTSSLSSTGEFSFEAVFDRIGTNTITIIAERDGHSTTLNKDVYYVPYASTYTPKAWPMDATNYAEFLNNTATRVSRTQIYVCVGTVVELLSSQPQMALFDTDESEEGERLILLENLSRDTWVVGERYRIYADAYGTYDGKPRLVARYTYAPLD